MTPTLPASAFTVRVLPLPRTLEAISTTSVSRRTGATKPRGYTGQDPATVRLYHLLHLYAAANGTGEITPEEIRRRLNVSRMTAWRALRRLSALRIVSVYRKRDGRSVRFAFLLREVYRLWKLGATRVIKGVLAFCLSFPQDVYPPHAYLTPPRGVKRSKTTKDDHALRRAASIRAPGYVLGRLRKAANDCGIEADPRASVLLSTVGHMLFQRSRLSDFAEHPGALLELEAQIRARFPGGPPVGDNCLQLQKATGYPAGTYEHRVRGLPLADTPERTYEHRVKGLPIEDTPEERAEQLAERRRSASVGRRVWAWARATVEDALIAARIGRTETRVAMLAGSAAIHEAQARHVEREIRRDAVVAFEHAPAAVETRELVSAVMSGGGIMGFDDLDKRPARVQSTRLEELRAKARAQAARERAKLGREAAWQS